MSDKSSSEEENSLWPKVQKGLLGVISAAAATIVYSLFGATILNIVTRLDFIYGIAVGTVIGSILTILLSPYWSNEIKTERPTDVTVKSSDSFAEIFIKILRPFFLVVGLIGVVGSTFAAMTGQFAILFYFLIAGGGMYFLSPKDYSELSTRQVLFDFSITLGWLFISILTGFFILYFVIENTIGGIKNNPIYLDIPLMIIFTLTVFGSIILIPFWLLPAESEQVAQ